MKRLCRSIAIIGLLILLLPIFAYAQCTEQAPCPKLARLNPAMMGSVPAVSDCCTTGSCTFIGSPGDSENFEYQAGDFCCTEWAETDPDGVISTYDTAQNVCGSGHSLSFTTTDTDSNEDCFVYADLNDSGFNLRWYARVSTIETWTADYVFLWYNTSADQVINRYDFDITFREFDGNAADYTVRLFGSGAGVESDAELAVNTWYRYELTYVKNGTTTLDIYTTAGVAACSQMSVTAGNRVGCRYLVLGLHADTTDNKDITYYIDGIKYDSGSSGALGACP